MKMTIDKLINELTLFRNQHGGNCEVRIMAQETYPFEYQISGVTDTSSIAEFNELHGEGDSEAPRPEPICYVVDGRQIKAGDRAAWQTIGQ